jgi:hypothetical protein
MRTVGYRHIVLFSLSLSCLLIGFLIYFFFRPDTLFLHVLSIDHLSNYYIPNSILRGIVKNHSADAIWAMSLYLLALGLYELKYLKYSGKIAIMILPFIIEVAQYFKILPGTFDWYDLLTYAIILSVFSGIIPSLNILKYEKD